MGSRSVVATEIDERRRISALINDLAEWSSRSGDDAIRDIIVGEHRYYVVIDDEEVDIVVDRDVHGAHLRTDPTQPLFIDLRELADH